MKLIYTVNPSWSKDTYEEMTKAGIHCYRINAAHIEKARIGELVDTIKALSDRNVVFFDFPGTKARIWGREANGGKRLIQKGTEYRIVLVDEPISKPELQITGAEVFNSIAEGDILTVRRHHRHNVSFLVLSKDKSSAVVVAQNDGVIGWGYHIFIRNSLYEYSTISSRDMAYIDLLNQHKPHYLCQSFTDNESMLKDLLSKIQYTPFGVFAKIETPHGVKNMQAILHCCDGLIIARDDLSAYYSEWEIKLIGEKITYQCRNLNKIAIPASNYFSTLATDGKCSAEEFAALVALEKEKYHFVYCNETNKCSDWKRFHDIEKRLLLMEGLDD